VTPLKKEQETPAPHLAFRRGERVVHVRTGVMGTVDGYKNEGVGRGHTVVVRCDAGCRHHYRPHRIARAEA
jgi:hypothetical protein